MMSRERDKHYTCNNEGVTVRGTVVAVLDINSKGPVVLEMLYGFT